MTLHGALDRAGPALRRVPLGSVWGSDHKGAEISSRPFEPRRDLSKTDVAPAALAVVNSGPIMAAKKTPSKSDFIRSQPTSVSAAEVVKKGKARGSSSALSSSTT